MLCWPSTSKTLSAERDNIKERYQEDRQFLNRVRTNPFDKLLLSCVVNRIKHRLPRRLAFDFPNHRQHSWFYQRRKMLISFKINSFLVKVALSRTQAAKDRPANTVVDIDGGLKQGTEGATNRRAMSLQVFHCGCTSY